MSEVRVHITVSADGYVAGPNQSEQHPLGEGGGSLRDWAFALRAFRDLHGMEGGETNASTPVAEEALANVGAEIMGRGSSGAGPARGAMVPGPDGGARTPPSTCPSSCSPTMRDPLTLSDTMRALPAECWATKA